MEDKKSKKRFTAILIAIPLIASSVVLGQTPEEEVEEFNNQWGIVLADQIPALDVLGLGGLLAPPPGDVITAALGGSVGELQ